MDANQEPKPHRAVKVYDRPKSASKISPSLIGAAIVLALLVVAYELYRHFAG